MRMLQDPCALGGLSYQAFVCGMAPLADWRKMDPSAASCAASSCQPGALFSGKVHVFERTMRMLTFHQDPIHDMPAAVSHVDMRSS